MLEAACERRYGFRLPTPFTSRLVCAASRSLWQQWRWHREQPGLRGNLGGSKNRSARCPCERIQVSSSTKRRASLGVVETLAIERGRCHFSLYQNIAIGVWVAQANTAAVEAALGVAKQMAARFPGRHSSVAFLLDGLPGPLPEAMPLLAKLFAKRSDLACTAMILEGSGFWASGLRSMVNNARREGGSEAPLKIGTSIDQVVDWLSAQNEQQTGVAIAPTELAEALAFARHLGEQARGT
jgi:hypothetical protein